MQRQCGKCKQLVDEKDIQKIEVDNWPLGFKTDLWCTSCINKYNEEQAKKKRWF